ncbi:MAG: alpha/beta fold hydrolase [Actinobacteria bacterium]|nr:alpha/beta fold hydrolase [Actinomycetota bacterium]
MIAVARLRALAAAGAAALTLAACTSSVATGHGSAVPPSSASGHSSTGSASTPSGPPNEPTQPPASFADCKDRIDVGALGLSSTRAAQLSFYCATISVPLDYAQPQGTQIQLQLLKIHSSTDTTPIGSLLVNPGGPGGSGLDLALGIIGQISDKLLAHFDIIGFDPRGVGQSTPIECLTDQQKDALNAASPDVLTAAGFAQAKAAAKEVASACSSKYGAALAQYDTVQTARDMDQIRQAVGDKQLNYLGFSYGTELGAQYLHLFPTTMRVAVLDGAVDPLTDDITSFANQLQGFESAFDQFAAWCKQQSSCKSLGDPRQAVYSIAAQATKSPIPSSTAGETRKATSSIVYTGVLSALYSKSEWSSLGTALIDAGHGDSSGLFTLADQYNERYNGHYTNISDANTTISCNDSKPGPSDATIKATAQSWAKRFPMFGLWSAASLFSCQQWQPQRTVPPLPTAPTTPNKVLVIGNLHDPATPYQGAKDLAKTLGNAEVLTWNGEGHTSYLQGSTCIDNYVDSYLVSATLPPAGEVCPP